MRAAMEDIFQNITCQRMTMKISEQLLDRLNKEGYNVTNIERLYPGYHQRSVGSWSWRAWKGGFEIGSQISMKELLTMDEKDFNRWID
jgi:hypothetical protein